MPTSARASTRISIRWPPAPASEPTDTLVLSLDGYYVDLRVTKEDQSLDWALAGERITVSEDPLKVKFTHIINSQQLDTNPKGDHVEDAAPPEDVGDFVKLPNGDDFETGEMAAPHLNGKVAPYEEVWRQLSPTPPHDCGSDHARGAGAKCSSWEVGTVAWILESVDTSDEGYTTQGGGIGNAKSKIFFARVGRFYLAIRRVVGEGKTATFSALRQEYTPETEQWRDVYAIGDVTGMSLSSSGQLVTDSEYASWKVGDHVTVNTQVSQRTNREVCTVRAVARLDT